MEVAEVVELLDVIGAPAVNGGGGDGEELIGGPPHGGCHYHRAMRFARADDAGDALDSGSALDGGAAELHHDHQSSIPSECISSAFKTAAPAAPRMVLWLRTTNL